MKFKNDHEINNLKSNPLSDSNKPQQTHSSAISKSLSSSSSSDPEALTEDLAPLSGTAHNDDSGFYSCTIPTTDPGSFVTRIPVNLNSEQNGLTFGDGGSTTAPNLDYSQCVVTVNGMNFDPLTTGGPSRTTLTDDQTVDNLTDMRIFKTRMDTAQDNCTLNPHIRTMFI